MKLNKIRFIRTLNVDGWCDGRMKLTLSTKYLTLPAIFIHWADKLPLGPIRTLERPYGGRKRQSGNGHAIKTWPVREKRPQTP